MRAPPQGTGRRGGLDLQQEQQRSSRLGPPRQAPPPIERDEPIADDKLALFPVITPAMVERLAERSRRARP